MTAALLIWLALLLSPQSRVAPQASVRDYLADGMFRADLNAQMRESEGP